MPASPPFTVVVHNVKLLSQQAARNRSGGLKSVGSERAMSPSPPAGDDGIARAKTAMRPLGGTVTLTLGQLQKEGLIEKDSEGKWQVSPKGLRRIQDSALASLFQTFNRDAIGRHDTPQKGEGSVRLEDSKPYVYGDSLANLNLHETLTNALIRQGGGLHRQQGPPADRDGHHPGPEPRLLRPVAAQRQRGEPVRAVRLAGPDVGVARRLGPPHVLLRGDQREHRQRQRQAPALHRATLP